MKFRNKQEKGRRFHKFGFGKFQEFCKRRHLEQICESQAECKNTEQCHKIHPKSFKRFNSGNGCKHGEECAYNHKGNVKVKEVTELKDKIDNLEKTVAKVNKEIERFEQLEKALKAIV